MTDSIKKTQPQHRDLLEVTIVTICFIRNPLLCNSNKLRSYEYRNQDNNRC